MGRMVIIKQWENAWHRPNNKLFKKKKKSGNKIKSKGEEYHKEKD